MGFPSGLVTLTHSDAASEVHLALVRVSQDPEGTAGGQHEPQRLQKQFKPFLPVKVLGTLSRSVFPRATSRACGVSSCLHSRDCVVV